MKRSKGPDNGASAWHQVTATRTATQVGKTIRALRKARELTLEQLAHLAETDAGSLSRIERGKQGWTHESITAIANALGVPVGSLFDTPPTWIARGDEGCIIVPHYASLDGTQPGEHPESVPFPRAWLPHDVRPAGLVWMTIMGFNLLVDTNATDLADGKLVVFRHLGKERVRRVFWRYDKYLRLTPDTPSAEVTEEIIPPSQVSRLDVVGRVVWIGGGV